MLDFIYMVPKLIIRQREAFFSSSTTVTDRKAHASGYAHIHIDTRGIDFAALSTYPSNEEIEEAENRIIKKCIPSLPISVPRLVKSTIVSAWNCDITWNRHLVCG